VPSLKIKSHGQITFEFLIITAAFFSFMLIILGPLENALDTAIFAADAISAENFAQRLGSGAESLSLMGEGSSKRFESGVLTKWHIFSDSGKLFVEVTSEKLGKEKKFPVDIVADLPEMHFVKKASVIMVRNENGLTINADADSS
jgi:hypothetical protein